MPLTLWLLYHFFKNCLSKHLAYIYAFLLLAFPSFSISICFLISHTSHLPFDTCYIYIYALLLFLSFPTFLLPKYFHHRSVCDLFIWKNGCWTRGIYTSKWRREQKWKRWTFWDFISFITGYEYFIHQHWRHKSWTSIVWSGKWTPWYTWWNVIKFWIRINWYSTLYSWF